MTPTQQRALANAAVAAVLTMLLGFAIVSLIPGGGSDLPIPPPPSTKPGTSCTPSWESVPSPDPQDGGSLLLGVSAVARDDAWAVGGAGDPAAPTATLTVRWNGAKWSVVQSPNPGTVSNVFEAVSALSPDAAWAVGRSSDGVTDAPFAAVWDGAAWTLQQLPTDLAGGGLTGVAAVSTDDVWAVGYVGTASTGEERALVLHWDGERWRREQVQAVGGGQSRLTAISVSAADDVWAVGIQHNTPLFLHFDGRSWDRTETDMAIDVAAVTAMSADSAWAVGSAVALWDGKTWAERGTSRGEGNLRGVASVGPDDVWAVGVRPGDKVDDERPLVQRWDGTHWAIVPGTGGSGSQVLTAVTALSDGTVLGVGYRDVQGDRSTFVLRGTTCVTGP